MIGSFILVVVVMVLVAVVGTRVRSSSSSSHSAAGIADDSTYSVIADGCHAFHLFIQVIAFVTQQFAQYLL